MVESGNGAKKLLLPECPTNLDNSRARGYCVEVNGGWVFSSPEHEVLMMSYCDQSLSIIRALSTFCFKISPPKRLDGF